MMKTFRSACIIVVFFNVIAISKFCTRGFSICDRWMDAVVYTVNDAVKSNGSD